MKADSPAVRKLKRTIKALTRTLLPNGFVTKLRWTRGRRSMAPRCNGKKLCRLVPFCLTANL